MDIGAATGGFTDVLLQNGARHVYAIDVGYGQLDWKIRNDDRVTVMERTNARYLTHAEVPCVPDVTVMDVSFIQVPADPAGGGRADGAPWTVLHPHQAAV